jgi:hypothetical protein
MKRLLGSAYRNPARAPEHQPATRLKNGERADRRPSSRRSAQTSTATGGFGHVPIFAKTREGLLERLAYYEARKLTNLPNSLLDYHDVAPRPRDSRRAPGAQSTRQQPIGTPPLNYPPRALPHPARGPRLAHGRVALPPFCDNSRQRDLVGSRCPTHPLAASCQRREEYDPTHGRDSGRSLAASLPCGT